MLLLATVAPGPDAAADTLSVLNWASKFRSDTAARRACGLWTSPEGDLEAPVALRREAVEPVKRRSVQMSIWGWGLGLWTALSVALAFLTGDAVSLVSTGDCMRQRLGSISIVGRSRAMSGRHDTEEEPPRD